MNVYTDPWLASNPVIKQADYCFFDTISYYNKSIDMTVKHKYLICEYVKLNFPEVFPNDFDVFRYVSDYAKNLLREKRTFIIFNMSYDGGYVTFPYYKYFYHSSKKHQIPQEQIIFITGGHTERERYKNLYPDTKIYTAMIHLEDVWVKEATDFAKINRVGPLLNSHSSKYFTYLSRRPRYWRSALTMTLHSDEYLSNRSILSHCVVEGDDSPSDNNIPLEFVDGDLIADPSNDPVIKYFEKHGKIINSGTVLGRGRSAYPATDLYNQVLFDVVGETYQARNEDCLSEKTFKAMNVGIPVIIWGTHGINKQLEKLGFKLYTDWFDYSFDDEPDEWLRLNKLVSEIRRVCNYLDTLPRDQRLEWSLQNRSVLKFNKQLIGNIPFIKNEIVALLKILNGE